MYEVICPDMFCIDFCDDKKGAFSVVFPVIDDSPDCHVFFSRGNAHPFFAMFYNAGFFPCQKYFSAENRNFFLNTEKPQSILPQTTDIIL